MSKEERQKGQEKARKIWQACFPRQPFEIDLDHPPFSCPSYKSHITCDLTAAANRQRMFYYQVSLPHYRDKKFLSKAVERYGYFLKLKKVHPAVFLVPCYDMDLIWHVHQLHPLAYRNDTIALFGSLLNHDDTNVDRSSNSKLSIADEETNALWSQYGLQYKIPGAMYRGEAPLPPSPTPRGFYFDFADKRYNFALLSLEIKNLDPTKTFKVKLLLENSSRVLFRRKVKGSYSAPQTAEPLCCFQLVTTTNSGLRVEIAQCGILCHSTKIVDQHLNIKEKIIGAVIKAFGSEQFKHSFELKGGAELQFTTRILDRPEIIGYSFMVTTDKKIEIKQLRHPADILAIPKLFLSPTTLEKHSVPCEMLLHRVINNFNVESFFCRVVHSAQIKLSVIEIIDCYGNIVATSHLIDRETLPQQAQLDNYKRSCSYEPACGERAMLIKGRYDWGIAMGRWLFYNRNIFGGSPGHLQLGFFSMKGGNLYTEVNRSVNSLEYSIALPCVDNAFRRCFMHVDLATGRVSIPMECDEVPEALALAVSIGVLFLLCQPYVPQDPRLSSAPALSKARLVSSPRCYANDELQLVVAAGFYSKAVPTNVFCYHYFDQTYGKTDEFRDASVCVSACGGCVTGGLSTNATNTVNRK